MRKFQFLCFYFDLRGEAAQPRFNDVGIVTSHEQSIRVRILGRGNISLLHIDAVTSHMEYIMGQEHLEWEFIQANVCKNSEIVAVVYL